MRPALPLLLLVASAAVATTARGDRVVLKSGKTISGVVVSRHDDQVVVINPWNSRHPGMTWEIPDKNRIPASEVAEVIVEDPPEVEILRAAARPGATADDLAALARRCLDEKRKKDAEWLFARALLLDPEHADAVDGLGGETKVDVLRRKRPDLDPAVVRAERAFLAAEDDPQALAAAWGDLEKARTKRPLEVYLRARRSAKLPKGRRDEVPLTFDSDAASGATYCILVPESYDPLVPTGLVVALHGGGRGGKDETLVTGSGESAMNFYMDQARAWNWIVVCPTALKAPWSDRANQPLIHAVLDEIKALYHVDLDRIYLTGHSMGGFGAWHWGLELQEEVWAAFAPCAGTGRAAPPKIPIYLYHGSDDPICRVSPARDAARAIGGGRKAKVDFVYTELDGVGHGFPREVRDDLFRWFAGRAKGGRKKKSLEPRSSFDPKENKVDRREIEAFGDPRKLPDGDADDSSVKELIAKLRDGGGAGVEAAEKLAALKDKKVVSSLAAVLKHRSSTVDARVLATRALGGTAIEECVAPLEIAAGDDDFRVVDEAVSGLRAIGGDAVVPGLERAGKRLAALWDASFFGRQITHTELEVRCRSFGAWADALAAVHAGGAATARGAALPLLDGLVVGRVFDPSEPYVCSGDSDDRFKDVSKTVRAALADRVCAAAEAFGDPAAAAMLERIPGAWPNEPRLRDRVDRALQTLR